MGFADLVAICFGVTAILAAIAAIIAAGVAAWRFLRKMSRFVDDWFGEEPKPDGTHRRGIPERLKSIEDRSAEMRERLAAVEAQLLPNGGGSIRDAIDRLASPDGATPHRERTAL